VRRREIRRLIINMPPRSLKSHCASIVFPAWLLGHDPSAQIIAVSYAQDFADRLARECRSLMSTLLYRAVFPTRLSPQKQATAEFETTGKGYRISTSVGGVLTGRGGDFLIIDDPLKPEEALSDVRREGLNDWYDHTLYTRQNRKATAAIVIIMQRLHEDDLVGHVLRQEPWEVLSFPAIADRDEEITIETPYGPYRYSRRAGEALHPEHESLETLAQIRETIGPYNFAGQYLQSPAPLGGGIIKIEWFKTYDRVPERFDRVVQSWDTASVAAELNSFSVCTTWGLIEKHAYLLHVQRARLNYPELKRAVREQAQLFKADVVLIEHKASGIPLYQELAADGIRGITKYEPQGDKVMRMHGQTAFVASGFVHLPREAHWLGEYVYELTTFPNGAHDDQVDSTSQALDWIQHGLIDYAGWVEYYENLAKNRGRITPEMLGKPAPLKRVTMRAPGPNQNYYVSGTDGRAGCYSSDAASLIFNVHPDDVERLQVHGCVIVETG